MLRDIISSAKPSRSTLRVASLVTILLVGTLAAPISFTPPGADEPVETVGTAEAQTASTLYNNVVDLASTFFIGNSYIPNIDEDRVQKLNETDELEAKLDIHANSQIVQSQNEVTFSVIDNYNSQSRNIAWIEAKEAIIDELNSGGSESSAQTRAKTAIRDFYTVRQKNLIEQWNVTMTTYEYLDEKGLNVTGTYSIEDDYSVSWEDNDPDYNVGSTNIQRNGLTSQTVTLANSSTAPVKTWHWVVDWDRNSDTTDNTDHFTDNEYINPTSPNASSSFGEITWTLSGNELYAPAPNSDYEDARLVSPHDFYERWQEIQQQKDQMVANVDPFVSSVYTEYTSGELNISDVQDPYTLASEYTTEYNETGYYAYAVANNALLGLDTPDLNTTSLMNVSVDGTYYNGMIMGNLTAYNDSLSVNQTYSFPSTMTVQMATTDGQLLDLSGQNVTLNRAEDKDGQTIQNVTYRDYNYQTANVSELEEQLEQINELQAEIEEIEQQLLSGGTTTWPDLGDLGPKALGLILVGAAVLIGRKP